MALAGLILTTVIAPTSAHEFWLWPDRYVVGVGDQASATIRIGQDFKGNSYRYNPNDFERFASFLGTGELQPVEGELGDRPAFSDNVEQEGLLVLVHQTDLERLSYAEFEKFESFAMMEGADQVIAQHRARSLPESDFEEVYRRFAKSYIQIGHGRGADRPVGMELELTARTNPYTADGSEMEFHLTHKGASKPDTQVTVWSRKRGSKPEDGNLAKGKRQLFKTDENGLVSIPTQSGFEYLASAVLIVEPGPEELEQRPDAVWYSLWASATWMAPSAEGDLGQ